MADVLKCSLTLEASTSEHPETSANTNHKHIHVQAIKGFASLTFKGFCARLEINIHFMKLLCESILSQKNLSKKEFNLLDTYPSVN